MGCIFSSYVDSTEPLDCARIIHINGYIQDFSCPVTTAQITGKPPKHVLCTSSQLLSVRARPLQPEDPLESGRIYFLLPHSVFCSDTSPADLASLATRLTKTAKRARPADPRKAGKLSDPKEEGENGSGVGLAKEKKMVWRKPRTWKPLLETIREISFQRGESMVSFERQRASIGSVRETGVGERG